MFKISLITVKPLTPWHQEEGNAACCSLSVVHTWQEANVNLTPVDQAAALTHSTVIQLYLAPEEQYGAWVVRAHVNTVSCAGVSVCLQICRSNSNKAKRQYNEGQSFPASQERILFLVCYWFNYDLCKLFISSNWTLFKYYTFTHEASFSLPNHKIIHSIIIIIKKSLDRLCESFNAVCKVYGHNRQNHDRRWGWTATRINAEAKCKHKNHTYTLSHFWNFSFKKGKNMQ